MLVVKVALTNSAEQAVQQRALDVAAQITDESIEAATPTIQTGTPAGLKPTTAQSLLQVQKVYSLVGWLLLLGSPFLLAAFGAVTWGAVGRSLRRVDRIRERVETIGGSDLHERVPVPAAKDDVAALATTMNRMLGRLETSASSQRRIIADASHELRSPLTSISSGWHRPESRAKNGRFSIVVRLS
jgi:signal transduction histidine kinase